MEKDDLSETEEAGQVIQQDTPLPKQKRKLQLSEEERKRRGDNLRNIVAKRKAENDKVNQIIKKDVDEVKHEVKLKAYKEVKKRVGKIKAEKLNEPETDSDSDSDDEIITSSKKKRKNKNPTIIIKNYTLPSEPKRQYKEPIAEPEQVYKPEPIIQQPPVRLGYFV
jgi:hypothetical protein